MISQKLAKKSIGVVLCAYNGEKFLRAQLESILEQTRPPDRIFVLDDRSTDKTARIVKDLAEKDRRITLIVNEVNLGYARNFEKGISICDTDFIALCDQDDIWLKDKLEKLSAELEANPGAGMVFCNAEYMLADGTRTGHQVFHKAFGPVDDFAYTRVALCRHGSAFSIHGHLMLIDSDMKSLILPNPIPRSHGHDSWICLNAFFLRSPRYVAETLSLYRLHPKQASGAIALALKGTRYQYKKKWYDHRRLARNLLRIFTAPFKRRAILMERKLRARNYASDMLMVMEKLLAERQRLGLPSISREELSSLKEARERWQAVIDSNSAFE